MAQRLLADVPLFASLSAEEVAVLVAELEERSFVDGQLMLREGDPGDDFFILLDGGVEIIKALGTADERLLSVRGAGDFVGEMSLINQDGLRTASVRASGETRALTVTRAAFDTMVRRHPAMTYELLRVMSVRLRAAHDGTIRDLHEKNQRLAQAYADLQAAQQRIIEQETLLRELRLAREIQESMLPTSLPQLAGYDIGARCLPARMVGGDFFDVIRLDEERVGIAIGDVSGKGVPAALFMALCSSLLRAEVIRGTPPEHALRLVNAQLIARNAQSMFVTLIYGVLHGPSGEFHYVRAGHEYPLAWERGAAPLELPHGRGMPLGLLPSPALDVQTAVIPPGSTLLLYTDGATEAADSRGAMLGYERFCELAGSSTAETAQGLVDRLVDAALEHQGEAPQFDDITLVALRAGPGAL